MAKRKKKATPQKPAGRIVAGVASSANVDQRPDLAKRIEAAYVEAIEGAMAEGISLSDPEIIARKNEARFAILDEDAQRIAELS